MDKATEKRIDPWKVWYDFPTDRYYFDGEWISAEVMRNVHPEIIQRLIEQNGGGRIAKPRTNGPLIKDEAYSFTDEEEMKRFRIEFD